MLFSSSPQVQLFSDIVFLRQKKTKKVAQNMKMIVHVCDWNSDQCNVTKSLNFGISDEVLSTKFNNSNKAISNLTSLSCQY